MVTQGHTEKGGAASVRHPPALSILACKQAFDAAMDALPAQMRTVGQQARSYMASERSEAQSNLHNAEAMKQYGSPSIQNGMDELKASTELSRINAQQVQELQRARRTLDQMQVDLNFYYGPCLNAIIALSKHIQGKIMLSPADKAQVIRVVNDPRFIGVLNQYNPQARVQFDSLRAKYLQ